MQLLANLAYILIQKTQSFIQQIQNQYFKWWLSYTQSELGGNDGKM